MSKLVYLERVYNIIYLYYFVLVDLEGTKTEHTHTAPIEAIGFLGLHQALAPKCGKSAPHDICRRERSGTCHWEVEMDGNAVRVND